MWPNRTPLNDPPILNVEQLVRHLSNRLVVADHDDGLVVIESWKEEVRRGYLISRRMSGEVIKRPAKPDQNGPVERQP